MQSWLCCDALHVHASDGVSLGAAEGAQAGARSSAGGEGDGWRAEQALKDVRFHVTLPPLPPPPPAPQLALLPVLLVPLHWHFRQTPRVVLLNPTSIWRQLRAFPTFRCPVCSKVVRKSIARVLTVISQNQKRALREDFKGKVTFRPQSLGDAQADCLVSTATIRVCLPVLCKACDIVSQRYLPLDLRPKKTRAIRRRLTPYQVRQQKHEPRGCEDDCSQWRRFGCRLVFHLELSA